MEALKIVFMGTPEFAVPSLAMLLDEGYHIAAVVTVPDRPAGRGKKISMSPVKEYALRHEIKVMQPENLKAPTFIDELRGIGADIIIVVAFRILPEVVWAMPAYGTFNLHASLLPQYRGAAPINRAIMNGEEESGLTTFFLKQKVDTGNVLLQEKIDIPSEMTYGELHDIMKDKGARLVIKSLSLIEAGDYTLKDQQEMVFNTETLKAAPKIHREHCHINWSSSTKEIRNMIRGLSPVPAAYTHLLSPDGKELHIKIYNAGQEIRLHSNKSGMLITDRKNKLGVYTPDGIIWIKNLQVAGKKRMDIADFLNGYSIGNSWFFA